VRQKPGRASAQSREEPAGARTRQLSSVEACEADAWSLVLGARDRSGKPIAVPFRCGSWRCSRCAWRVAREDYRRIEFAATSRPEWLYVVLTFDPARGSTPWKAYAKAGALWHKRLRRRLERVYGRLEYVQTWEQTRAGWPHVNLLLRSDALMRDVHARGLERRPVKPKNGKRVDRWATFPKWRAWFRAQAIASGFGRIVWVEHVGQSSAMAAYLTKVAGEFIRSELKHGDQRPTTAPRGFRRLRSSQKLLPPRERSSGEWIGGIARRASGAFVDPATGECAPTWADVDAVLAERARRVEERREARELVSGSATPQAIATAARTWSERVWTGPAVIPPRGPRPRRKAKRARFRRVAKIH
jgi:hypothetical protein